jgi:hypothetical protein
MPILAKMSSAAKSRKKWIVPATTSSCLLPEDGSAEVGLEGIGGLAVECLQAVCVPSGS